MLIYGAGVLSVSHNLRAWFENWTQGFQYFHLSKREMVFSTTKFLFAVRARVCEAFEERQAEICDFG